MATIWVHSDVLDNGLNYIKNNANQVRLISAYSANDSFSTVNTNTLCTVTVDSTDFTVEDVPSTSNRRCVLAAQSGTATEPASSTPDLHYAIVDSANSKVLWVTYETSDPSEIVDDAAINFGSVTLIFPQPTSA